MQFLSKPIIIVLALLFSLSVHADNWNYLVKTFPLMGNNQALTQAMNKLGAESWELASCSEVNAQLICIFKRPTTGK
ncbi:MAG: hypothetical protein V3T17_10555 [Pseudomonadales bacterium]